MWDLAVEFFMIVTGHFVVARPIINTYYLTILCMPEEVSETLQIP